MDMCLCCFHCSEVFSLFQIDRGTDPIDPPPTQGQQALLNQARQFARQVTEERRATLQSQV